MKKIDSSRLHSVAIYIDYDEDDNWDAHVICQGQVLDETGEVVGDKELEQERSEMSSSVRNTLDNFLKHMSKEFNIKTVDEDKETLKSK